jgi:Zn-dependent protease with chaperone function
VTALLFIGDSVGAGILTWIVNYIGLRGFRRSEGQHWTERARQLFPARAAAITNLWVVPAIIVLAQSFLWPSTAANWLLTILLAAVGTTAATWFFDREVVSSLTGRQWLHQALAGTTIRLVWSLVFLWVGASMPREFGLRTMLMGGALAAAYALWSTRGFMLALSALRLVDPASAALRQLVQGVEERMGVKVKRVSTLKSCLMQAYALPYTGELMFSDRLLEKCTNEELAAITAHEISHLGESALIRIARLIRAIAIVSWVFLKPGYHLLGPAGVVLVAACPFAISLPLNALSRKLESRADRLAVQGEGSQTFALALAKLYEGNLMPAVMPTHRTTHPDLYDRLLAVGVEPDFPRPAKPSKISWPATVLSGVLGLLVAMTFIRFQEKGATEGMYDEPDTRAHTEFLGHLMDGVVEKMTGTVVTNDDVRTNGPGGQ